MTKSELLHLLTDLLIKLVSLDYGPETAPDKVRQYDQLVSRLQSLRRELSRNIITDNTAEFKKHTAALQEINNILQADLGDMTNIAETLKSLIAFVAAVEKIASIATGVTGLPSISALAAGKKIMKKAKSAHIAFGEEAAAMQPELKAAEESTVEQMPLLLVEEVLHGVELTEKELLITVISGGCTDKGYFRFDVNKGTASCTVTVYRVVSDDCRMAPELKQLAFSREKLGLDGTVEFILRNKIGNTANQRLPG